APPPAATSPCAERAARLDKRLHDLAAATPGFMPLHHVDTPSAPGGKPFDTRGFVLAVTKDGKFFTQGAQLAGIKEAGDWLDAMSKSALEKHAMAGGSTRDAKWPLYIWADA